MMGAPINYRIENLYQRLIQAGLDIDYVRNVVMPDWWDDSIANTPSGHAEAIGMLSRRLNIDLAALQDQSATIIPRDTGTISFKKQKGITETDVNWAKSVAIRAVCFALQATDLAIRPSLGAEEIRNEILGRGAKCVSLEQLLDYCWHVGIVVLHISNLPKGKKMDGMAIKVNGKLGIVISSKRIYPSWLLFILAHELGHIGSGHLDNVSCYVDEEINQSSTEEKEIEATNFALRLIAGSTNPKFNISPEINVNRLKDQSLAIGLKLKVHPGTIILDFAWKNNKWQIAMAALQLIEGRSDAREIINEKMKDMLIWNNLSEDNQEFLLRVTSTSL